MTAEVPGKRQGNRLITHYDPTNPSGHPSAEEAHDALLEKESQEIVRRGEENTYKGLVAFFKRTNHELKDVIKAWNEAQQSKHIIAQGEDRIKRQEKFIKSIK